MTKMRIQDALERQRAAQCLLFGSQVVPPHPTPHLLVTNGTFLISTRVPRTKWSPAAYLEAAVVPTARP